MATSDSEPAKQLLPYLQRADELQRHEPLVAYYCRLYAMDRGLHIPQKERTKTTNALLLSLMKQLEKDKKVVKVGPEDNLYLEGFASNVFAKADKQDRAGRADLNTAKTFYAASIFYDILNQFGDLQPDIEQKQKYALWKAAEIRKAIKEGRQPEPGPPGDEDIKQPGSYVTEPSQTFSQRPLQTDQLPLKPAENPSFTQDLRTSSTLPSAPLADRSRSSNSTSAPSLDHSRTVGFTTATHEDQPSYPGAEQFHSYAPVQPLYTVSPEQFPPHASVMPQYTASSEQFPPHSTVPPQYTASPVYTAPTIPGSTSNYNEAHSVQPNEGSESSAYPHSYPQPPYKVEPQHPQSHFADEDVVIPSSFPHFQSYPSFQESTLPAVPSRNPSFFYRSDSSTGYPSQAPPAASTEYQPPPAAPPAIPPAAPPAAPSPEQYRYDSNYQPTVEKIADAHKAARFAVGALAFDDVVTAVDHLRRALDLLTNPSADANRH